MPHYGKICGKLPINRQQKHLLMVMPPVLKDYLKIVSGVQVPPIGLATTRLQ